MITLKFLDVTLKNLKIKYNHIVILKRKSRNCFQSHLSAQFLAVTFHSTKIYCLNLRKDKKIDILIYGEGCFTQC